MDRETIKRVVGNAFSNAGDISAAVNIIQLSFGVHTPGYPETTEEVSYSARLMKMQPPKGKSSIETGPVLDNGYKVALLHSGDYSPVSGDILEIGSSRFALQQVVSLDHGMGILFEVWYQ